MAERAFDSLAIGQEEKGTEVERNARLEEQGDDTEQDDVADGVAENLRAGFA
ncbi:hypothetical protein [Bradyrhizobium sp. USDA 336]|uniref:hypothetical protein n=1 Tax=Bradyrhizobium sp. USDA 336 TaxID=3156311 RepID=UPI00384CCE85